MVHRSNSHDGLVVCGRVRIQAANVVGAGPFSSQVKITTRPLPPEPPQLECVSVGSNSLKLKWGDGRNTNNTQYTLEMSRDEATSVLNIKLLI